SGKFEPGKLAPREQAKLPPGGIDEAIRIVQQLLIWQPNDSRLLWQLGELYNAKGDRVTALRILEALGGLGGANFRPAELVSHRIAIKDDLDLNPPAVPVVAPPPDAGDPPAENVASQWKPLLIGFVGGL